MQKNPKIKNTKFILDSSALITLLKKESGYQLVEANLAQSAISTVNLCELISILARNKIEEEEIDLIVKDLVPTIIPFCQDISDRAGKLASLTKDYGLSLDDRACIATAEYHHLPLYTTDLVWAKLQPHLSVKVILIR